MVELRKITKENYLECLGLSVADEQKDFVTSNTYSLAQAWVFYNTAYPFAVYADETLVGFIMLGYLEKHNEYTVWRLMIDKKFQGKGYGKAALKLGIEYLQKEFGVSEICLSFVSGNKPAEAMYESLGFQRTGEVDGNEIAMSLKLTK